MSHSTPEAALARQVTLGYLTRLPRQRTRAGSADGRSDDLGKGMQAGLAVACLADVPDNRILGRNEAGLLAALRAPEPGFVYAYRHDRLVWIDELVANHGLRRAPTAADLEAAHSGRSACDRR